CSAAAGLVATGDCQRLADLSAVSATEPFCRSGHRLDLTGLIPAPVITERLAGLATARTGLATVTAPGGGMSAADRPAVFHRRRDQPLYFLLPGAAGYCRLQSATPFCLADRHYRHYRLQRADPVVSTAVKSPYAWHFRQFVIRS